VQFPISIELRRSFIHTLLTCAIHGTAVVCLITVPLDWYWRVVALPPIAACLWGSLRSSRFVLLRLAVKGGLSFFEVDGKRVDATLLPGSAVFTWLVVLRFLIDGERKACALTLLPDQMSRDEFRKLRLWLRWNASAGKCDDPGDEPDS